jgi:hypothetical protein
MAGKKASLSALIVLVTALMSTLTLNAQDTQQRTLAANQNNDNAVWFIEGEDSLVMNGFDLAALGIARPAAITSVSIAVDTPIANTPIDVVVYQDADGGSPVNAEVASRAEVTINQAGVFTATLPTPALITEPVVWVGFYLPVGFRFLADTSGSSVLTWWAWSEGTRFGLSRLDSAQILGPADGTAPVNIDMDGIARISATISSNPNLIAVAGVSGEIDGTVGITADLSVIEAYEGCETLFYDRADIVVSLGDGLDQRCQELYLGFAPEDPAGFERKQLLYDLTFFADYGVVVGNLRVPVTHCVEPNPADAQSPIAIGVATGAPRQWRILPSARVNNLVCAELPSGGLVSYFVEASDDEGDDDDDA